jgi:uridine phosphorylase
MIQRIPETDLILNKDGSVYHLNLLPEHISDTIIAVGDPDRVGRVSRYFDSVDFKIRKREFVTHGGKLNGHKITVISTGMGTDNVEIFFTELDALVNIDLKTRAPKRQRRKLNVIRIGTSGAFQKDIPLDSHVVSDYAIGMDNLMYFYNLKVGDFEKKISKEIEQKTGSPLAPYVVRGSTQLKKRIAFDMIPGNTVTCPGFYAPQGRSVRLVPRYPALLEGLTRFEHGPRKFKLTNFEMETAGYYAMAKLMGHESLSVNAIIANRAEKKFSKNPNKVIDDLVRKVLSRCV